MSQVNNRFPLGATLSGTQYTIDLNDILAAIDSANSGESPPTNNLVAGKLWLDTNSPLTPVLKIYDVNANGGLGDFVPLGEDGNVFRTIRIYKNASTAPATPTNSNTFMDADLGDITSTAGWKLAQETPSSGEFTYTSVATFIQTQGTGDFSILAASWSDTSQLSGDTGTTGTAGARGPVIGFYVPMVTRSGSTFTSTLSTIFNPNELVETNEIKTTPNDQNYLDASFSQHLFGNLNSDAVEGDYGLFYNSGNITQNIIASYNGTTNLWVTAVQEIAGNLIVSGSITADSLSADAITGKIVKGGGKSSATDTTNSGFFFNSDGTFIIGGTNGNLAFDTSGNLTIPAATITNQLVASQITAGTITANEIATGTITATQLSANSITAEKIASLELSVEKNISVGNITVTGSGSTVLTEVATLDDMTIVVDSVTGFPDTGVVLLNGTENFNYTSRRQSDSAAVPPVTAAFISTTDKIVAASFPIGTGVVGGLDITFLTVDTEIDDTTISVNSVSGFSDTGTVFLDGTERFSYDSRDTVANTFSSTIDKVQAVHLTNVLVTGVYEVTSGTGVILEGAGRFSVGSVDNSMTFDGTTLTISGVDLDAKDLQNLSELDGKISASLQTYSAALAYDANAVVISANRIFRSNGSVAASNPPEDNTDNTSPFAANSWTEISAGDVGTLPTAPNVDTGLTKKYSLQVADSLGTETVTWVEASSGLNQTQVDARVVSGITGKQDTLTSTQLTSFTEGLNTTEVDARVVSGITGKQDTLTSTELTSFTEGLNTTEVDARVVSGITGKQDTLTSTELTSFTEGLNTTEVDARVVSGITGKQDSITAGNGLAFDGTTLNSTGINLSDVRSYTTIALRNAATDTVWHQGDVAIVTGGTGQGSHVYTGTDQTEAGVTTTSDWTLLVTPTDVVTSVNTKTGAVVLGTGNISETSSVLYFTNARADARVVAGITGKQDSLTTEQLTSFTEGLNQTEVDARVVSGITGKQDTLTSTELTSFTEGLNTTEVDARVVSGITGKQDTLTSTQLTSFTEGLNTTEVDARVVAGITGKQDSLTTEQITDIDRIDTIESAKQDTLTSTQLTSFTEGLNTTEVDARVVSGITGKQDTLTSTQLTSFTEGLNTTEVDARVVSGITGKQDTLTSTELTSFTEGLNTTEVDARVVSGITGKQDTLTAAQLLAFATTDFAGQTSDGNYTVPTRVGATTTKFLREDGGWVAPSTSDPAIIRTGTSPDRIPTLAGEISKKEVGDLIFDASNTLTNEQLGLGTVSLDKIAITEFPTVVWKTTYKSGRDDNPDANGEWQAYTDTNLATANIAPSGEWDTIKGVKLRTTDGGAIGRNITALIEALQTGSYVRIEQGADQYGVFKIGTTHTVSGDVGSISFDSKFQSKGTYSNTASASIDFQVNTDAIIDGNLIVTGTIETTAIKAESGVFGNLSADTGNFGTLVADTAAITSLTAKFLNANLIIVDEIEAGSITADKIDTDTLTVRAANVIGEITVGSIRDTDGAQLNFQEYLLDGSLSGPNAQPRANASIANVGFTLSGTPSTATVNVQVPASALGRFARPVVSTATDTIPVALRVVEFGYLGRGQSMYGRGYTNGMYNTGGSGDDMYRRTSIDLVSDYSVIDPSALFDFGTPNLSLITRQEISVRVTADVGTQVRFNVYGQGISEIIRFDTTSSGTSIPTTQAFEKIENIIVLPIYPPAESGETPITGFAVELENILHTFSGSTPTAGTVLVTVEGY